MAAAPRSFNAVERRVRALTTAPLRRSFVATGAAVLLALAALVGPWGVAIVMVGLQIWFASGWMRLLGLPSVHRGAAVVSLIGVAATAISLGTRDPQLLVLTLAAGVVAAFVVEMRRQDGRPRLVEDISGIVGGTVAVTCGAGWIIVSDHHPLLTVAAALALAASSGLGATPLRGRRIMLLGLPLGAVVAVVGGVGAAWLLPRIGLAPAPAAGQPVTILVGLALLGLGIGAVTTTLQVLLTWLPSSGRRRPAAAAALLPVLLVGVPLELIGMILPR